MALSQGNKPSMKSYIDRTLHKYKLARYISADYQVPHTFETARHSTRCILVLWRAVCVRSKNVIGNSL